MLPCSPLLVWSGQVWASWGYLPPPLSLKHVFWGSFLAFDCPFRWFGGNCLGLSTPSPKKYFFVPLEILMQMPKVPENL